MSERIYKIFLIFIIAISAFLFLHRLGDEAFIDYDEAGYAQIMDTTLRSGDFLTLRMFPTQLWFEKPPLYLWLGMITKQIIPLPEMAYRLPSAIFGILSVILTILIAYELSRSRLASVFAGAALLTTGFFLEAARQVRMDVLVTAAILFAFFSFLKGKRDPKWYLGIGVGIAVGVLTKSVIGLFVLPALAVYSVVNWEWEWLKDKFLWLGILLGVLIVLPWHIYEYAIYGADFWNQYFYYHILGRFNSDIFGSQLGNGLFIKLLFSFSMPWLILLVPFILSYLFAFPFDAKARKDISLALATVSLAGIFLLSKTKLLYYFIPVLPFAAIFIGLFFGRLAEKHEKMGKFISISIFAALFLVGFWQTIDIGFHHQSNFNYTKVVSEEERLAGLAIKASQDARSPGQRVDMSYVKGHNFFDTLKYYSGGLRFEMAGESGIPPGHYLVLFKDNEKAEIKAHRSYKPIFTGNILSVLYNP